MNDEKTAVEKWKNEIIEAEEQFAQKLKEDGLEKAFLAFAAEDAVLMRNNNLIIGKPDIAIYLKDKTTKKLSWKPDFVDVSASGDLAYTFGKYSFSYADENGIKKEDKGVFHTVWKRQTNGTWKFVWD